MSSTAFRKAYQLGMSPHRGFKRGSFGMANSISNIIVRLVLFRGSDTRARKPEQK